MKELSKTYDPKKVEDTWFAHWEKEGYFHSEPSNKKAPFCVMIPPPNVTGMLTMGHVLNNTLQDVLVRKARMQGFETMWLPGTDHAGIATQARVEKHIRETEKKTRHDFGREKFVERIWDWKDQYGGMIIRQLRKLGVSCDWERERFTLDEGLSKAVREVFVQLYEKDLIYKGKRIINWCPVSHTALSDEEVIHQEKNGKLWHFKYPVKGEEGRYLIIATTRPETMLGDTAVAVHPEDERYADLVGKSILLPLVDREIPIVRDDYVDVEFGTGAVKITPAHDPNDYEIGLRHDLEFINIMNEDASMNEVVPEKYRGMDRYECRKAIVADLDELGLLDKIEDHVHKVGYSERANVPVEARLSEQWFVKMEPLAKPALEAVNSGKIKFNPERWVKTYNHWLENIRDWCISRQLWWGHRIPVFTCTDCGWESAEREDPTVCPLCGSKNIKQDTDVLDTWFSSWLWPFSTLGWPESNEDLKYYYPTDDLVTAPDIIFFWVARMIMAGYEFMGDIPFKNVYFTGLIRDMQGRKMSKSLGNSPDPLEVIDQYGADALRYGMMLIAPKGHDILFDTSQIELGRNFMNKLWNASRFVLMNVDETIPKDQFPQNPTEADKEIITRLKFTIQGYNNYLDQYRFNDAAKILYDFTWSNFCSRYFEAIKKDLFDENSSQNIQTGVFVLRSVLKLLHPYAPFITEEIWQSVKTDQEPDIMVSDWPKQEQLPDYEKSISLMSNLYLVSSKIREIRSENNVPPSKKVSPIITTANNSEEFRYLQNNKRYIESLTQSIDLNVDLNLESPPVSGSGVLFDWEIYVPIERDIDKEKERLEKEIASFEGRIKGIKGKLNNENFVSRAPENVVQHERNKLANYEESLALLKENYAKLAK